MSTKPLEGKKIAVLVETEYIHDEIEYYKNHFPALGAEVHVMSYLWGDKSRRFVSDIDSADKPVKDIHTMVVDIDVTNVDPNDYDIVIMAANYCSVRLREIPPMGSHGSPELARTAPAVEFFRKAMLNTKIIKGALCHALWILTPNPELLKGRRVICHSVVLSDVVNAGGIFTSTPEEVVVDDDLVTGRSAKNLEAYFNAMVEQVVRRDQR